MSRGLRLSAEDGAATIARLARWRAGEVAVDRRVDALACEAKPAKAKFHNEITRRGEVKYHSKGEALLADHLDLLKLAGEVAYYLRQVPFFLVGGVVYRIDFQVFYVDGRVRYLDFKGVMTKEFITKCKIVEATYPVKIELVTRRKGEFMGL